MILGIGSDLVDISRIERSIDRFGDRFLSRIFTDRERDRADSKANRAAVYAKRFAAKEAVWKALGEEDRPGIQWRELEVINDASGKPSFELSGIAAARLLKITPEGLVARVDLSLTDEPPMAQAFVVISAEVPGLRDKAGGQPSLAVLLGIRHTWPLAARNRGQPTTLPCRPNLF